MRSTTTTTTTPITTTDETEIEIKTGTGTVLVDDATINKSTTRTTEESAASAAAAASASAAAASAAASEGAGTGTGTAGAVAAIEADVDTETEATSSPLMPDADDGPKTGVHEPWEVVFKRLELYKEEHGNCNVPAIDKLGRWVKRQREHYRLQKLTHERVDALESIGFQWKLQYQKKPRNRVSTDAFDESFRKMVERVVLYVEKHGHGYVPQKYEDKKLASWSMSRRREKVIGKLNAERIEALQNAGFVWKFKKVTTR
jgi:hypothetical protein